MQATQLRAPGASIAVPANARGTMWYRGSNEGWLQARLHVNPAPGHSSLVVFICFTEGSHSHSDGGHCLTLQSDSTNHPSSDPRSPHHYLQVPGDNPSALPQPPQFLVLPIMSQRPVCIRSCLVPFFVPLYSTYVQDHLVFIFYFLTHFTWH